MSVVGLLVRERADVSDRKWVSAARTPPAIDLPPWPGLSEAYRRLTSLSPRRPRSQSQSAGRRTLERLPDVLLFNEVQDLIGDP